MGADFSFYVKSIATYAPAFLVYNNSVLARVYCTHLSVDTCCTITAIDAKLPVGFNIPIIYSTWHFNSFNLCIRSDIISHSIQLIILDNSYLY